MKRYLENKTETAFSKSTKVVQSPEKNMMENVQSVGASDGKEESVVTDSIRKKKDGEGRKEDKTKMGEGEKGKAGEKRKAEEKAMVTQQEADDEAKRIAIGDGSLEKVGSKEAWQYLNEKVAHLERKIGKIGQIRAEKEEAGREIQRLKEQGIKDRLEKEEQDKELSKL